MITPLREFAYPLGIKVLENHFRPLFVSDLWPVETLSLSLTKNGKATWLYYLHLFVSIFPFFPLSVHCSFM